MKHDDMLRELRQDAEYVAAEKQLKAKLDIADDVLRLRIEKGWSQAELARRVGTRQANISKLENGLSNPTLEFLTKVANALETDFSIRFGAEPTVEPVKVVVREVKIVKVVDPEVLWGTSRKRTTYSDWVGLPTGRRNAPSVDRYHAA